MSKQSEGVRAWPAMDCRRTELPYSCDAAEHARPAASSAASRAASKLANKSLSGSASPPSALPTVRVTSTTASFGSRSSVIAPCREQ